MTTTRLSFDLDRLGVALSAVCLAHCLATSVALAMLSAAGGMLGDPIIHELGLALAIGLGAVALGRGALRHGFIMPAAMGSLGLGIMAGALSVPHDGGAEVFWTIVGVGILAFGHDLNRRADA